MRCGWYPLHQARLIGRRLSAPALPLARLEVGRECLEMTGERGWWVVVQVFDVRFRSLCEVRERGERLAMAQYYSAITAHNNNIVNMKVSPRTYPPQRSSSPSRRRTRWGTVCWATPAPGTRGASRAGARWGRWRPTTSTRSDSSTSAQSPGQSTGGPASKSGRSLSSGI